MMEIILAALLCVIGFLIYLLNKSKDEIFSLKTEINKLRTTKSSANQTKSPPIDDKRFVQVIFNPNSKNCYDYLLGNNTNIQVGDFVEVYVGDKDGGKPKWSVAQIIYISKPGEVSEFAKSKIKRKSNRRMW